MTSGMAPRGLASPSERVLAADRADRGAAFPAKRMRRLRATTAMRRLVAETMLAVDDLVAPLFVREGIDEPVAISSLPGHFQHTVASLVKEAEHLSSLGIPALVLFGIPEHKDPRGLGASDPSGIVQVALSELKARLGDRMVLMSDLCLDEYTDHGHCGIVSADGAVDNDATLERYQEIAVAQAEAGADVVAPSGMMDGQVAAIRSALDGSGHEQVAILAYSAKYASALYGPFRDAVGVEIVGGGDRRSYQQDPPNAIEALAEVALDVSEGADMVMVKPALAYLDIIAKVSVSVDVPVLAYHVSGEYAMLKAAAERGWLDAEATAIEHLLAIKRAGARAVLTYLAREAAEAMQA
jgi:porphobilinogen synthase